MHLKSNNFHDGGAIPGEFAFAVIDPAHHIALSKNHNPHLTWTGAPHGTRSFAVICMDPDVPSKGDDVNREGREVSAKLPRVSFSHWLLWDIPASTMEIAAGSQSKNVTPHGKPGPAAPGGMKHGINGYTAWFAGDPKMKGDYFGYDGPCPPWNDAIAHRYVFTVYALDVEHLPVKGGHFTEEDVRAAMKGHVLAEASLTGRYSLNPKVKA